MIDVQKLAREADLSSMTADAHCREDYWTATHTELERFAALVLEEAAKVCDDIRASHGCRSDNKDWIRGTDDCAHEIRSLKPKGEA